jgi:hypothetical protein
MKVIEKKEKELRVLIDFTTNAWSTSICLTFWGKFINDCYLSVAISIVVLS